MFLSLPSSSSYVLDTASPEAFQRLLDFIYTKKPYRVHQGGSGSEIQVVKLVLEVLGLANRFKICQLVVLCERVVESLLVTSDNCQDVREILCSSADITDKARSDLIRKYWSLVRRRLGRSLPAGQGLQEELERELLLFATGMPSQVMDRPLPILLPLYGTPDLPPPPLPPSHSATAPSARPHVTSLPAQDLATSPLNSSNFQSPPSPSYADDLFDAYTDMESGTPGVMARGPTLTNSNPTNPVDPFRVEISTQELVALLGDFRNLSRVQQEGIVEYIKKKEQEDPELVRKIKKESGFFR
jgi:hypothetical protein